MIRLGSLSPLIKGSAVVMLGSLGGSFLNYLFHFLIGRFLTPAEYGVVMSLFSVFYILAAPKDILGTAATKFAAHYKANADFKSVTEALVWVGKITSTMGLVFLLVALIFRNGLADFLKINDPQLVALFFVFVALTFVGTGPMAFLRGLSRFKSFSFIQVIGPLLKLVLGVGLAYLGLRVWGVIWGLTAATFLVLLISLALLKKNLRFPFRPSSFSRASFLKFALPTAVVLLSSTSFYNTDVILVKHFFAPGAAGIYSSAVTLGRIIFFGLSSIALVMFPLASEKHSGGADPSRIFKNSLALVTLGAVVGSLFYFIFPGLLVSIFFGKDYLPAVPYLGRFAVFMGLYAVVDLVSQFYLSVSNFRAAGILFAFALIQMVALLAYHQTLSQVITINIGVMVGVLAVYAIDYLRSRVAVRC